MKTEHYPARDEKNSSIITARYTNIMIRKELALKYYISLFTSDK